MLNGLARERQGKQFVCLYSAKGTETKMIAPQGAVHPNQEFLERQHVIFIHFVRASNRKTYAMRYTGKQRHSPVQSCSRFTAEPHELLGNDLQPVYIAGMLKG